MLTWNRLGRPLTLAALGLLISLQGGTCLPPDTSDGNDGAGSPVRNAVGPDGGVVEATNSRGDKIRLELPAGALTEALTISLEPLDAIPAGPIADNAFPGVDLLPEGLKLLKPAKLQIALAAGPADADALLFQLRQADFAMPLGEQAISGNTISGRIRHFSRYFVATPSDTEASQQAGKGGGQSAGPSDWQSTLDFINGMAQWGEWFESHGMQDESQSAFNDAEQALREAIECFINVECHLVPIDVCDEDYIREALALQAQTTLLGFDEASRLMQDLNAQVTQMLNVCTNRFEIEYDYLQVIDFNGYRDERHVTGRVLFSVPVYGVSDLENPQATGQGTVTGTISGNAGECAIVGNFAIGVVVEGELESDEMGQPWLNLQLHESWYSTGQQNIICDDDTANVPLFPAQSTQPIRLLVEDGYVLEQPHLEAEGHYRWTLHVLHLW